ncbi:MAG: serine/threonine-protein phosphatase [Phycisphaerae bacterium]|nr:serine/threonine-protein phosphatase [Phycisphaerae bacterium]
MAQASPALDREFSASPHVMSCQEIWGGNQAADDAVSIPGLDAWVLSRPFAGDPRGGDIHYVSLCGKALLSRYVLADVSGHGASVDDLASRLWQLMRESMNEPSVAGLMRGVNDAFHAEGTDSGRFATALVASYIAHERRLVLANAGHPPPLWYRAAEGRWQWLQQDEPDCHSLPVNLPLGVLPGTDYCQLEVVLETGDLVLMFTDSMIEAADRNGRQIGADGLLARAADLCPQNPEGFRDRLVNSVGEHRGGREPDDDLTVLMLRHNGMVPAMPPEPASAT